MEFIAKEEGYLMIYTANETNEDLNVFMDDMTVTHTTGPIVRVDDYYPFGLTFNSSKLNGKLTNKFLYNGKEKEELTDWYDYGARMYDPAIGKFPTIDPMSELMFGYTPYHYVLNNPIIYTDPTGMYTVYDLDGNPHEIGDEDVVDGNLGGDNGDDNSNDEENGDGQVKGAFLAATNIPSVGIRKNKDGSYSKFDTRHKCDENCTLDHWTTEDQLQVTGELLMFFVGGQAVKWIFKRGRWVLSGARAAKGTGTAFDVAKAGGKHAGFFKNYVGRNPAEINKAINSLQAGNRGINVHLDKIANPSKYVPNWNILNPAHQQSLIRGWQKEITNATEQIQILRGILGQ